MIISIEDQRFVSQLFLLEDASYSNKIVSLGAPKRRCNKEWVLRKPCSWLSKNLTLVKESARQKGVL